MARSAAVRAAIVDTATRTPGHPAAAPPPVDIATRKRGRPAAETPQEKLVRLERELVTVRQQVREAEQRKFVVLGQAVAAEAADNPDFKAKLAEVLARRVTSAAGKAEVAPLLAA